MGERIACGAVILRAVEVEREIEDSYRALQFFERPETDLLLCDGSTLVDKTRRVLR